jgi:hypothetical protein
MSYVETPEEERSWYLAGCYSLSRQTITDGLFDAPEAPYEQPWSPGKVASQVES